MMRLALLDPQGSSRDLARTLARALAAAGGEVVLCRTTDEVCAADPDLAIAASPCPGKLTQHPTIAFLETEPAGLRQDWSLLKKVLSCDGWLVARPETGIFLSDLLSPTDKTAAVAVAPSDDGAAILQGLAELAGRIVPAGGMPENERVDYIMRIGGRRAAFVRRALESLAAQSAGRIGVILVRHGPVAGLDGVLQDLRPSLARLDIIDTAPGALRSTCLWAGLENVQAPVFGILDDDDRLHPDHVASLLPLLRRGREALAYSGAIRVLEASPEEPDDGVETGLERRSLYYLDPPQMDRLYTGRWLLASNSFLARSELRTEAGPDPLLAISEDAYLLRRFGRVTDFRPSWRPTAEFYWRADRTDNTAFDQRHRDVSLQRLADRERLDPRVRRRQSHAAADHDEDVPVWGELGKTRLPKLAAAADFAALPSHRPLFVYGAGRGGQLVVRELEKFPHLRIAAVLDSVRSGDFLGHPLLRPADVPAEHRAQSVLVIASQHVSEIDAVAEGYGFRDRRDAFPYIRTYIDLQVWPKEP